MQIIGNEVGCLGVDVVNKVEGTKRRVSEPYDGKLFHDVQVDFVVI